MTEHISIATDAGSFDALAAGPPEGRGVLFLHGFPQAGLEWSQQLEALGAAGYRAVAFDQRGYSPDVRPAEVEAYTDDRLAGDVLAVADELELPRFDVVGHDWGAHVAWVTAARAEHRIRTLTAVSVPHPSALGEAIRGDEDQRTRSQYMLLFGERGTAERKLLADPETEFRRIFERAVPDSHVREYIDRLTQPGALTAALNWYRAMRANEPIGPVRVPTLYVWSTEDVAIGSVAALDTERHVTGPYRFEMLEDVTHWVPEQAPQALTDLLLDHLGTHAE